MQQQEPCGFDGMGGEHKYACPIFSGHGLPSMIEMAVRLSTAVSVAL